MDDAPGYLPPIGLGETVRSAGIGEIVRSNSDRYAVGDLVVGFTGWQDYSVADEGSASMQVIPPGIDPPMVLSVLGATGMTAYFGMIDVGGVSRGRHGGRVGSGRGDGVGSRADRTDQAAPARSWASPALPRSARGSSTSSGFDAAVNYKSDNVAASLRSLCPERHRSLLRQRRRRDPRYVSRLLAMRGRIVLCGAISMYNEDEPAPGPAQHLQSDHQAGRMEGFLVLDYLDRFLEAQIDMVGWVAEGKVKHAEHSSMASSTPPRPSISCSRGEHRQGDREVVEEPEVDPADGHASPSNQSQRQGVMVSRGPAKRVAWSCSRWRAPGRRAGARRPGARRRGSPR